MPIARSLQVAQRTGIFAALAEGPQSAEQLAERLELQPQPTALVLDVLTALGHVRLRDERYELSPRARRWLEPGSDRYLGDFLADNYSYWEWWDGLERLLRDGESVEMHDRPADDPYWNHYIRGQYQLARLSSDEVAKAVALALRAASRCSTSPAATASSRWRSAGATPGSARRSSTCRAAPRSGARSSPRPG